MPGTMNEVSYVASEAKAKVVLVLVHVLVDDYHHEYVLYSVSCAMN